MAELISVMVELISVMVEPISVMLEPISVMACQPIKHTKNVVSANTRKVVIRLLPTSCRPVQSQQASR